MKCFINSFGSTIREASVIYGTFDPTIFVNAEANRDINITAKLKKSIQERGLLREIPIVTVPFIDKNGKKKFKVVDGGHRLEAACEIKKERENNPNKNTDPIEFFFIVSDSTNYLELLALLNNTQIKWRDKDWVKYWLTIYRLKEDKASALRMKPFATLQRLIDEYSPNATRQPYGNYLKILTRGLVKTTDLIQGHIPYYDEDFFRTVMGILNNAKAVNPSLPMGKTEFLNCVIRFVNEVFPVLTPTQKKNWILGLNTCVDERNTENTFFQFFHWCKFSNSDSRIKANELIKKSRSRKKIELQKAEIESELKKQKIKLESVRKKKA